jgi:glycosyltransferase involved in cell wall biosynthesis
MTVIILTQYYPPEIGAPQARLSALAEYLAREGHEVTVLTAMPNYPIGKVYDGYGGPLKKEMRNGVRLIRSWIYPAQSAGMVPRLLNYFSFVVSSLVAGLLLLRKADYLMTESPPLFLGLTGFVLSRAKRARWIFNVSDLWPESAVHLGKIKGGSRSHKMGLWIERFCYRHAWLVSGQAAGIVRDIETHHPHVRTYLLSNGVFVKNFGPERRDGTLHEQLGSGNACVAIYAGLHGIAQGLDQILSAVADLAGPLKIVFVGDGPEKQLLMDKARSMRLNSVEFRAPVKASEIPAYLASADVILVPLAVDLPGAIPSKLYEGMASARPVLLVASGEPARIVEKYECGLVVKPGDIRGLRAALETLCQDANARDAMGAAGRRAAVAHYDRETILSQFVSMLNRELTTA